MYILLFENVFSKSLQWLNLQATQIQQFYQRSKSLNKFDSRIISEEKVFLKVKEVYICDTYQRYIFTLKKYNRIHQKTLRIKKQLSKFAEYKINKKKSIVFLHISNGQSKNDIK